MKCPVDDSTLSISSREGIEIDFCPKCRGVWLDRGELDKIIERTADALPTGGAGYERYDERRYDEGRRYDDDRRYDERRYEERRYDERRYDDPRHGHGKRKKKSFLGDLFEFGGDD